MKKLSLSVFLFFLCSLTAFAASKANIHISYDSDTALVCVQMSIADGDAIVGHFGLRYDPSRLRVVAADGSELPEVIPDTDENGSSYLTRVVAASSSHIVITAESEKSSALIVPENGTVLFGWYASKTVSAVSPETDGGQIACIYFRLNEDVLPQSLTAEDISPALSTDCEGLSGWKNGVMLIDSESRVYTYEERDGAELLLMDIRFDSETNSELQPEDGENISDEEQTPSESADEDETTDADASDEIESPDEPQDGGEGDTDASSDSYDSSLPQLGDPIESGRFSLTAHAYDHKLRFFWEAPADERISYYTLTLADSKGNVFRTIDRLVGITRSVTVFDLAPDFTVIARLTAHTEDDTSGTSGAETDFVITQTKRYGSSAELLVYTVSYEPGIGELYGFESEEVLFGEGPSKLPTVYPPEGYAFVGWSSDGENPIETETLCVYEDMTLVAVFEPIIE